MGLEFGFGAGAPVGVVVVESSALGFTMGLELGFGLGLEFGLGAGALLLGCALCAAVPFDPAVPEPPFDCAKHITLVELSSNVKAMSRPDVIFISPPFLLCE